MRTLLTGVREAVLGVLLGQGSPIFLLLVLAATVIWGVWKEIRARRAGRKAMSYHVLFNSRLGFDPPETGKLARLHDNAGDVISDPSMAVIRITNTGSSDISEADYQLPIRFTFGARRVQLVDVTEGHPSGLEGLFAPEVAADNGIVLPARHLNAGNRFKLLVLLSGQSHDDTIDVSGLLKGGDIVNARDVSQKNRIWRWRLGTAGIASLVAGALIVVFLARSADLRPAQPGDPACVAGSGQVVGSSAFRTAATQVIGSYNSFCQDVGAMVEAAFSNSRDGLSRVLRPGSPDVALHDGPATDLTEEQRREVVGQPVAIVPYSIVVNQSVRPSGTGPVSLSRQQVREIFAGVHRTWHSVDPRLSRDPVRIVGRTTNSGSRDVFERYVLGDGTTPNGQGEATSRDCLTAKNGDPAATVRCERDSTGELLAKVAEIPGAIGYADTPQAADQANVIRVDLDGLTPENLDRYPFWTVEYAYYRRSAPDRPTLAEEFVRHLVSDIPAGSATTPASLLAAEGYPPCSRVAELCSRRS